jgi:Flp pilus assembly protein TadG
MKIRQILSNSRCNNERGAILVWVTMTGVLLLSFLGFAFDGSYFYQHKRRMQTAADSAALAAALEKRRNADATTTEMETMGRQDAGTNGFTHGSNSVTVTITTPPTTGSYAGQPGFVEALIQQQHPTFFASLFNLLTPSGSGFNQTTVRTRAVAGAASSSCIYVLHPTASRAFDIPSGSTLNAGCGVQVNSSSSTALSLTSGSHLVSTDVNVTGGYEANSGSTAAPTPDTDQLAIPDPLAWLQAPSFDSCTRTDLEVGKNGKETVTIDPGTYCGGIEVTNASTLIMNPGEYKLRGYSNRGGFRITSGSTVQGNGVFIYNGNLSACSDLKKCSISLESNSDVKLTAMSTGYYAGVLFFQERSHTDEEKLRISIESGSTSFFHGTLYFPDHQLRYNSNANSSATSLWTAVVVRKFEISSNTTVNINFPSTSVPAPVRRIALVE